MFAVRLGLLVAIGMIGACSQPAAPAVTDDEAPDPEPGWAPIGVQPCDPRCTWLGGSSWNEPPRELAEHGEPDELAPLLSHAIRLQAGLSVRAFGYMTLDEFLVDATRELGFPVEMSDAARRRVSRPTEFTEIGGRVRILNPRDPSGPSSSTTSASSDTLWILDDDKLRFVTGHEAEAALARERAGVRGQQLALERERIRVTWDPVAVHVHSAGESHVTRALAIGGIVTLLDDSGREQPFTWSAAVRVLFARSSTAEIDAEHGVRRPSTYIVDTRIDRQGRFRVHVPMWEVSRVPGAVRSFQAAIGMTDLEPGGTWRPVDSVLPQSITRLAIAGPATMTPTHQRISAVSAPSRNEYEPIALVRAVHHLRSLGKDRALTALRSYANEAQLVREQPSQSLLVGNFDSADPDAVYLILRSLFEVDPVSVVDELQPDRYDDWPEYYPRSICRLCEGQVNDSNDYPFRYVGDIPFLTALWCHNDKEPLRALVPVFDWLEVNGRFRAHPLRPTDDPISAAESLARTERLNQVSDPRVQIWRALQDVVGLPIDEVRSPSDRLISDEAWNHFAEQVRAAHLRWDDATQNYVCGH